MLSQNTQFGLIWPQDMLEVTPFFGFFDDSEHNLCGENKNIAAFCAAPAFFRPDGLHSNKGLDTLKQFFVQILAKICICINFARRE